MTHVVLHVETKGINDIFAGRFYTTLTPRFKNTQMCAIRCAVMKRVDAPPRPVSINPGVVKKLLELHWTKDKAADGAKINPDAVVLTTEYLRLFVLGKIIWVHADTSREI